MTQITKEAIEAGLRITLSSVNMPAGECLHETDVREILEAALPFLSPIAVDGMNYNCPCQHPSQCDDSCLPSSPGKDGGQEVEANGAAKKYKVVYENGWVVRAPDGANAFEPGWRWNSRSSARAFRDECEASAAPSPQSTVDAGRPCKESEQ